MTLAAAAVGVATLAACSESAAGPDRCSIPLASFLDAGGERSSIPALTNPPVVRRGTPATAYLGAEDRVIGLVINGLPVAIPHKILWWHEVVELNVPGGRLTVTYSPLTGSSLVFDRLAAGVEAFEVSRYVLDSNLVLEDETGSLWPQLSRGARCGPRDRAELPLVAFQEMRFFVWATDHPETFVLSSDTGHDFLYTLYPYGDYERIDNEELIYPAELDLRRPPKERVLGIPVGSGGLALPFGVFRDLDGDDFAVIANVVVDGRPIAVFWNAFAQGAIAYEAEVDGRVLRFDVLDGEIRDRETGSVWSFPGEALDGPLTGARLRPVKEAYVAFWFAWAEFQPDTEIWSP